MLLGDSDATVRLNGIWKLLDRIEKRALEMEYLGTLDIHGP